jgi:hypothetical protein
MLWKGSAHQLWTKTFILALRRWQVAPLFPLCSDKAYLRTVGHEFLWTYWTNLFAVRFSSFAVRESFGATIAFSHETVSEGSSAGGSRAAPGVVRVSHIMGKLKRGTAAIRSYRSRRLQATDERGKSAFVDYKRHNAPDTFLAAAFGFWNKNQKICSGGCISRDYERRCSFTLESGI